MPPNLWLDEAISVLISALPLPQLLTATAADTHPPLFYLLHLSPVLPFLLSLPLVYVLGRKTGMLLFLVSPLHLYFATQIRMYSLAVFFYLLLLTAYIRRHSKTYLLAAILGLYTHYYFLPALVALSIFDRKTLKLNLFALLAFLPWLVFALQFAHPTPWTFPLPIAIPATFISYSIGGLGSTTLRVMLGNSTPWLVKTLALTISAWMFSAFVFSSHPAKKLFLFSLFASLPVFSPRAMILFSPLYLISLAKTLTPLARIILVCCLLFFFAYFYRVDYWYPALASLSKQLSQLPPESAVIHTSTYTYFPSQVHIPTIRHFLLGPSGLSPTTNQLLGVTAPPPTTFPPAYLVSVDLTRPTAQISITLRPF